MELNNFNYIPTNIFSAAC